jgi:hypothetical protein
LPFNAIGDAIVWVMGETELFVVAYLVPLNHASLNAIGGERVQVNVAVFK